MTPKRHKTKQGFTVGGWAYDDQKQHFFAIKCWGLGVGLPSLDDFIDSMPEGKARNEMLDFRNSAFSAFSSNNTLALKGWLNALWVLWTFHRTVENIRPELRRGVTNKSSTSKGGKARAATYNTGSKAENWKSRAAELREQNPARYKSKRQCAATIAEETGEPAETIRKNI